MTPELAVALAAGRAAVGVIRDHAERVVRVEHKGAIDLVTEVDLRCEQLIREVLGRHMPDVPVLGEEGGGAEGATTRWVVDPLDGTTNFVHGYPFYCTSVALEVDGEPVAGCVIDAVRGVEYAAAAGQGAWCGDRRMVVSDCRELEGALIGTGFPYDRRERADHYLKYLRAVMVRCQGIRRAGAAALELALLADGRLDAFWEFQLKPWDVAAGALLIREAGGRIDAVAGGPLTGTSLDPLASNGWLHDALRAALESA